MEEKKIVIGSVVCLKSAVHPTFTVIDIDGEKLMILGWVSAERGLMQFSVKRDALTLVK